MESNRTSVKKVEVPKEEPGENDPKYVDNHYSYIEPDEYVNLRLETLKQVYQERLPCSVWRQKVWDLTIICLGIVIAFFSNSDLPNRSQVVLVVTALIGLIKSWSAFTNNDDNYQLYAEGIKGLRDQRNIWLKTTKHHQQNKQTIEHLVENVEGIAMEVIESWSSSLSKSKQTSPTKDKDQVDSNSNPPLRKKFPANSHEMV